MNMTKRSVVVIFGIMLAATVGVSAECTFTNRAGGSFNAAANWDLGAVPGSEDNVHFTSNATYTVTWSATVSNTSAFFDAPGGMVTLNPGANKWQLGGALSVGQDPAAATAVKLAGGAYELQTIVLTNVTQTGLGSSFLLFDNGTLTTYGAAIRTATNGIGNGVADFRVGSTNSGAGTMTWNIRGGTNTVQTFKKADGTYHQENGNNVLIGGRDGGKTGIVNVSGSNTVFEAIGGSLNIGGKQQETGGYGGTDGNQLNITEGAKVFNTNTTATMYLGWTTGNNSVKVDGPGSLLKAVGIVVSKNANSTGGNKFVVTNGASAVFTGNLGIHESDTANIGAKVIVTGTGSVLTVYGGGGMSTGGGGKNARLLVENGGVASFGGNFQLGHDTAPGSNNMVIVSGPGSSLSVNTGSAHLYLRGTNCGYIVRDRATGNFNDFQIGVGRTFVRVEDAGSVMNLSGQGYSPDGAVFMATNGGKFVTTSGWTIGTGVGTGQVVITGSGSVWSNTMGGTPYIRLGYVSNAVGRIRVESGGSFINSESNSSWGICLGYVAGGVGEIRVSGAGSLFRYNYLNGYGSPVQVGYAGPGALTVSDRGTFLANGANGMTVGTVAGAAGSTALVTDGGILDLGAGGLTVGNYPGNSVSNSGGVFQFASAAPTIVPGAFGKVAVSGGTIAFRNIANADVKGNWTGTLTNILFDGNNTFRLDAATNVNAASQAYTFATGRGSTNYVNLELVNGSAYRGGSVTIGAGGSLTVTGGIATIASDLTFQSGGTCRLIVGDTNAYSKIVVSGNVSLGGATLDLQLTTPPQKDFAYRVIDNTGTNPISGQFGTGLLNVTVGGTNYVLSVRTSGGSGNDVVLGWFTKGTLLRVL